MFRSAILSLGLAAFVLALTGCGGSQQPKATAPPDQEKLRGQQQQEERKTEGTKK